MTDSYNIESLMREYGNDVLRTCYAFVKDVHTAEDLYQETFIKVYRHMDSFNGDCSVKTWITRIAVNTCKDYLKSAYSRHVVPMDEFLEDQISTTDDFREVENADLNEQIKDAVMSLPVKYREVVICVYYNEMSVADCAKQLDISEGTVKSRLSRAREKLKPILERRL